MFCGSYCCRECFCCCCCLGGKSRIVVVHREEREHCHARCLLFAWVLVVVRLCVLSAMNHHWRLSLSRPFQLLVFITRLLLLLSPQCGQSSFKASFTSYQVPKPNENRSITICSTCRQLVNTVRSRFLLHMLFLLGRSSPVTKCPIVTFPIGRPGSLPHPG